MERVVLVLIFFYSIGNYSQDVNDFTMIKDHIKTHGKRLSRHRIGPILFRLNMENRQIHYSAFIDGENISVTHLPKESKLPKYMVHKKDDSLKISAYYSRFDTEEDSMKRMDDWDGLVEEIKIATIPESLLENFELGNFHWERKEVLKAQKAYLKFVELMIFEGLNEQIPKLVRERLFKCRYTNIKPKN